MAAWKELDYLIIDDFSHGLLRVSEKEKVRKRKLRTFNTQKLCVLHKINIRMKVGAMLQTKMFSPHRFDLEALSHPV